MKRLNLRVVPDYEGGYEIDPGGADLKPGERYAVEAVVDDQGCLILELVLKVPPLTPLERLHVGDDRYRCCACGGDYKVTLGGLFYYHKTGFHSRCDGAGRDPALVLKVHGPDDPTWTASKWDRALSAKR